MKSNLRNEIKSYIVRQGMVRMKGFEPMPRGRLQKISVQKTA